MTRNVESFSVLEPVRSLKVVACQTTVVVIQAPWVNATLTARLRFLRHFASFVWQ